MGKGKGGDEWEGKGVGWKMARRDRKRKARAAKRPEEGRNAERAKRRKLAREEKAATTRTDDRMDEGATTTPTDEMGTSDHGRSLPSLDIGGSPGTPAFQSSPIPSASGVQPRLKKNQKRSKSFVFQRDPGTNKTFVIRHEGLAVQMPALQELFRPVPRKHEEEKEAADKGRGGGRRVGFHQDPISPALRDQQEKKAIESRAAIERQRRDAELDALCPPRALPPPVKDVRVTDAGG